MTLLLRFIHWRLLSTVAVLQLLLQQTRFCAESTPVAAIEITEARFVGSNALRVSWKMDLTYLSLPSDAIWCQLNLANGLDDSPVATKKIPVSLKRYIFWNVSSKNSYSVSLTVLTTDQLLAMSNVDFSPKYWTIPFEVPREPVSLSRCQINVKYGFTKELSILRTTEIVFTEQDFITIDCKVSGNPSASIRWYKDGILDETATDRNTFTLEVANKSHEGVYSCIAENQFGIAVFPGVQLNMAVLDPFSAMDQTPKYTVSVGIGLVIDCRYNAQSVPAATIRWLKLRHRNDPSPTPVQPDNSRVLISLLGSMVFVNTEANDTGLYMCTAINSELDKSVAGSLTFLEVADTRSPLFNAAPVLLFKSMDTQQVFIGDSVSIQCIFSGRPIPEITWLAKDPVTKNFQPLTEDYSSSSSSRFQLDQNGATLVIQNVDDLSPDQLTCEGRNAAGNSSSQRANFQLLIYEKPKFLVAPQNRNATIGETVVFEYKVAGRPRPNIQWTSKGKPILPDPSAYRLTLINVTKEMTSTLQLNISNSYGYSVANVYLMVFAPTIISSDQTTVSYPESGVAAFRCDAETDPSTPLYIKWNHSICSSPSYPNPFSSYHENEQDVRLVNYSTLRFVLDDKQIGSGKRRKHCLNFTCIASNGLTSAGKTIALPLNDDDEWSGSRAVPHSHNGKVTETQSDWTQLVSYVGYAATGVLLLVIVFVVTFRLKRCHSNGQPSMASSAAAVSVGTSLASDYDGTILSGIDHRRPSGGCRRHGTGSCSGHQHHHHQNRCDGQQCRGALVACCSNSTWATVAALQDLCIPRDRLQVTETIAQGQFGQILEAFLHDPRGELRDTVAVKVLNSDMLETNMIELFLKEPEVVRHFQHTNVLGVLGVTFERSGGPLIILPFMSNGDLRSYITKPHMDLTVLHLLQLGLQVARGMVYLSSLPVVHRHLRTKACLVNSRGVVKVADFGLTRELIARNRHRDPERGLAIIMRWMAVEVLEANTFSTMSDVWSFGVLLWELMTRGSLPFADVKDQDVPNLIQSGQELPQPQYCPDNVYTIMTACWNFNPLERPKFEFIEEIISEIVLPAQRGNQSSLTGAMYVNLTSPANPLADHSQSDIPTAE